MSKDVSFDISAQFDLQEIRNAFEQAKKEIQSRFDFKGVTVDLEMNDESMTLVTESEQKIQAVKEVINSKLAKRDQSIFVLDWDKEPEKASGMNLRQHITFRSSLTQEDAKIIVKHIKEHHPKAKASIQGDEIRVSSASKDILQVIIQDLKVNSPIEAALSFGNYR